VRADWRAAYGSPAHRDVLGAAMAIVQDRSRFGDIVMCGGYALLFCLTELADHVVMALTSAGRSTLRCIICDDVNAAAHKRDELRERRDTIPSFRLDACVASAFDLSRADAQSLINEGKVRLNHLPAIKCDAQVGESGLVSVRGIGRAVLKEKRGMNRKGRFGVLWECTFS
jgi:RNA-binding protein YlmH